MGQSVGQANDRLDAHGLARLAAEHSPDLLVVVDPTGVLRYGGRAATRMLGIEPDDHVGAPLLEFVHPEDVPAAIGAVSEATRSDGYHMPVIVRIRRDDGSWLPCEVNGETLTRPDGAWLVLALRSIAGRTDMIERREEVQRLIQRAAVECARARWYQADQVVEHFLEALASVVGAVLVELAWEEEEPDMTIGARWAVPGLVEAGAPAPSEPFRPLWPVEPLQDALLHFTADVTSLPSSDTMHRLVGAGVRAAVELPLPAEHRAALRLCFGEDWLRWDDTNPDVVGLLAGILLSTLRRCLVEEQLHERARRDPMTGLLNRNELYSALSRLPGESRQARGRLGVLYGDLDRFKDVNDRFGHAEGDRLVLGVAGALLANVRDGDLVARFGGDEFVVVCPVLEGPGQLDAIASRVEEAVHRLAPTGVPVGISFGRAMARPGQDADELLRLADEAMYRAKRSRGRSTPA